MKKKVLIVACILCCSLMEAQNNLVANGSFEQYSHCPNLIGEVDSCIGWFAVKNTPDYFNACADSSTNASVPTNVGGTQFPFEGNGYIGLITYFYDYFYREIVGTSLLDTLIPGNSYHISMRVSRGNWNIQSDNQTATNKMGMRFTTYAYSLADTPAINNYAQIYEESVITDTLDWVLLAWDYIPDSSYTHLYIGNFFDDQHTDTVNIGWTFGTAYYYIDSVNIICTDVSCSNGVPIMKKDEASLRFDNNSNSIYLVSNYYIIGKLSIINVLGQTIEELEANNTEQVNLSNLKQGLYILLFQSERTTLTKKIVIQK